MEPQMSDKRLELDMTIEDCIKALSGGVPGTILLLTDWANRLGPVQAAFDFMQLDAKGLYDSTLWDLYSHICGQDMEFFMDYVLNVLDAA
jgi:hypothetical protein